MHVNTESARYVNRPTILPSTIHFVLSTPVRLAVKRTREFFQVGLVTYAKSFPQTSLIVRLTLRSPQ